jgi:hypothetical protein
LTLQVKRVQCFERRVSPAPAGTPRLRAVQEAG